MPVKVLDLEASFTDRASQGMEGLTAKIRAQIAEAKQAAQVSQTELAGALDKVTDRLTKTGRGSDALTGSLKKMAKEGIREVTGGIPLLGEGLETLAENTGKFGGVVAGVVGAGVALIAYLKNLQVEAGRTNTELANLNTAIVAQAQATAADLRRIEADRTRDKVGAVEAGFQKTVALAEAEREQRVRKAQQAFDEELQAFFSTEASRNQAQGKFLAERAAAEQKAESEILLARKEAAAQIEEVERQQAEFSRQVSDQAKAAARDRARAEAEASGQVLQIVEVERQQKVAAIEAEKVVRLTAIREAGLQGQQAAEARRQVEQAALDATIAAEVRAADQRKQLVQGLTADIKGIVDSLGDGFTHLQKKLNLATELQKAEAGFKKVEAAVAGGVITEKEAAKVIDVMTDNLEKAGASGQQIADVLPPALKASAEAALAAEEAAVKVALAWAKASREAAEFAAQTDKARGASENLDKKLTKESLGPSVRAVGEEFRETQRSTETYAEEVDRARGAVGRFDEGLGRVRRTLDNVQEETAETTRRFRQQVEELGRAGQHAHPGAEFGLGPGGGRGGGGSSFDGGGLSPRSFTEPAAGRTPFAFPEAAGGPEPLAPLIRQTTQTFALPGLADVLAALALGVGPATSPFIDPGPGRRGGTGGVPAHPFVKVGEGPFGPIFQDAFVRLEQLKKEIRAQQRAQQRVQEFLDNEFAPPSVGGIGGPEALVRDPGLPGPGPRRPLRRGLGLGGGEQHITVNVNGNVIPLDSDQRLYDLASRVGADIHDRTRRGL